MTSKLARYLPALGLLGLLAGPSAARASSDYELAKDLQNPVADLVSVPLENRLDRGPGSTLRYTLNLQPVIPISLGGGWNLVSRTIVPVISAQSPEPGGKTTSGLGDVTQSFFFSPAPLGTWIVGAGPILVLPTATPDALGRGAWAAGPTAVALRQDDAWTYGALVSHAWSFAGRSGSDLNATNLQPFLAYTMESLMSLGLGSESTYDWSSGQWLVPLDLTVSQLFMAGSLPVDVGLGGRAYLARPAGGPDWAVKVTITLMFPTK